MGKKRARLLKKFIKEGISIANAAVEENKLLQKEVVFHMKQGRELDLKVKELEEINQNLHKKILELEQNKGLSIKKRLVNFFSFP